MPIIESAKKKLRKDKKRRLKNAFAKKNYKEAVKQARKKANPRNLKKAYSLLDKAAKNKLIHRNKAARLKSKLAHANKG